MKKRCFGWILAVAVFAVPWTGVASAATMPLSDLLGGGTIQSGDKVFSDFTYLASGDMPSAAGINVVTIQDDNGDYGIRFQGSFIDQVGGDASDAVITFNVSVAPGSNLAIKDVTMSANPAVFAGPGLASVTETFLPAIIDDKLVVYDFGGGNDKLLDHIEFAQTHTTLPVQKDIILHATGETGAVTMSFLDQTFSQVPEPSSLLLALGSLLGLGQIRRRMS